MVRLRADGSVRCQDCAAAPEPGSRRCAACAEALRVAARARSAARKAACKCVVCGTPANPGITLCEAHRLDAVARGRAETALRNPPVDQLRDSIAVLRDGGKVGPEWAIWRTRLEALTNLARLRRDNAAVSRIWSARRNRAALIECLEKLTGPSE